MSPSGDGELLGVLEAAGLMATLRAAGVEQLEVRFQ